MLSASDGTDARLEHSRLCRRARISREIAARAGKRSVWFDVLSDEAHKAKAVPKYPSGAGPLRASGVNTWFSAMGV